MVGGVAGIRTATMYLTAEELGKGRPENVGQILSSCFLYSILCSGTVGAAVYFGAPALAASWIGNEQTVPVLRLFAVFLPAVCLSGVMSGYFTAANRNAGIADPRNEWLAGYQYDIAVTIHKTGVSIQGCTITAWTEADGGNFDAK